MTGVPSRKGRRHGAVMMAWMFFANLFEPAKAAAIEHIAVQKRIGTDAHRMAAAAAAPPITPAKS